MTRKSVKTNLDDTHDGCSHTVHLFPFLPYSVSSLSAWRSRYVPPPSGASEDRHPEKNTPERLQIAFAAAPTEASPEGLLTVCASFHFLSYLSPLLMTTNK